MPQLSVLDNIRVASPCSVPWASMRGDSRTRFCGECKLNVYNLSNMTRAEAEGLILEREGRLCVNYFQRADGTVLTRDCPIGLAGVRRRIAGVCGAAVAAVLTFASGLYAFAHGRDSERIRLRWQPPFDRIIAWIEGPQPVQIEGRVAVPLTQQQMAQFQKQIAQAKQANSTGTK